MQLEISGDAEENAKKIQASRFCSKSMLDSLSAAKKEIVDALQDRANFSVTQLNIGDGPIKYMRTINGLINYIESRRESCGDGAAAGSLAPVVAADGRITDVVKRRLGKAVLSGEDVMRVSFALYSDSFHQRVSPLYAGDALLTEEVGAVIKKDLFYRFSVRDGLSGEFDVAGLRRHETAGQDPYVRIMSSSETDNSYTPVTIIDAGNALYYDAREASDASGSGSGYASGSGSGYGYGSGSGSDGHHQVVVLTAAHAKLTYTKKPAANIRLYASFREGGNRLYSAKQVPLHRFLSSVSVKDVAGIGGPVSAPAAPRAFLVDERLKLDDNVIRKIEKMIADYTVQYRQVLEDAGGSVSPVPVFGGAKGSAKGRLARLESVRPRAVGAADDSPIVPLAAVQTARLCYYAYVAGRGEVTMADIARDAVYSVAAFWVLLATGLLSERSVQVGLVAVLISWCLSTVYWSAARVCAARGSLRGSYAGVVACGLIFAISDIVRAGGPAVRLTPVTRRGRRPDRRPGSRAPGTRLAPRRAGRVRTCPSGPCGRTCPSGPCGRTRRCRP